MIWPRTLSLAEIGKTWTGGTYACGPGLAEIRKTWTGGIYAVLATRAC
jgi:hypothetical protein